MQLGGVRVSPPFLVWAFSCYWCLLMLFTPSIRLSVYPSIQLSLFRELGTESGPGSVFEKGRWKSRILSISILYICCCLRFYYFILFCSVEWPPENVESTLLKSRRNINRLLERKRFKDVNTIMEKPVQHGIRINQSTARLSKTYDINRSKHKRIEKTTLTIF